jgi:hypothetical protein
MKTFKITKDIEVVCQSESTRSGFRHLATLLKKGIEEETAKCCYLNRTWERYEFQSVLNKIVNKAFKNKILSEKEKKLCDDFIEGDQTDWSDFKATKMVAELGNLFCETKKDKNDWKARMIKAGLGNKGLQMPENWDALDEDIKEKRLNAIIKMIGNVPNENKNNK